MERKEDNPILTRNMAAETAFQHGSCGLHLVTSVPRPSGDTERFWKAHVTQSGPIGGR